MNRELDAPSAEAAFASQLEAEGRTKPVPEDIPAESPAQKQLALKAFAINGDLEEMKTRLTEDLFAMEGIAIMGQATVIYAKPNTGKTLLVIWFLMQQIKSNLLDPANVFFINADDTFRGLLQKIEIAVQFGFSMLAPGFRGFKSEMLVQQLIAMTENDTANGVVVVLDTLKKFTDPMDKRAASGFSQILRNFVAKGGTVIMLAHTNKHRDPQGKVVYSGTSDIVDDVDCAYLLDDTESALTDSKTVLFENIKNRGDVEHNAGFTYSVRKGQPYRELLDSVRPVDEQEQQRAKEQRDIERKLEKNAVLIEAIIEAISDGIDQKTALIQEAYQRSGESRKRAAQVLAEHTGTNHTKGDRWNVQKGERNIRSYVLLTSTIASHAQ